ncbi:MAG: TonB-dependent siderophore receptor [Opitutales bacterium]
MSILTASYKSLVGSGCLSFVAASLCAGFMHIQLSAAESLILTVSDAPSDETEVSANTETEPTFVLPSADASTQSAATTAPGGSFDDEVFVLEDFAVTSERDRGYYSANSLAGSRTNQAIKDTPMTISVVNRELIDDLKLDDVDSLEQVVASAQAEGEDYSNNALRFRGLLTRSQLFEFMPRLGSQKGYNVARAEVIRGANTLVYGQASPGGKVNFLAKRAEFGDDIARFGHQFGTQDLFKVNFDINKVVSDSLAVRVLGLDQTRGGDRAYQENTYEGATLAVSYRPSRKTSFGFHAEVYEEFRNSPPGMYRDQSGEYGLTGIYRNLPATPDVVDYLSDAAMQQIIDYDPTYYKDGNTIKEHETPQLNIQSREDLKAFYGTITPDNVGTVTGGDPEFNREGQFFLGDVTHQFTDALALKVALAHEEVEVARHTRIGATNLRLSSRNKTVRPAAEEPNEDLYYDGSDPATMPSPYVVMGWEASSTSDKSDTLRSTLSWDKEVFGSKQRILLGLDYNRREATERLERLVKDSATRIPDDDEDQDPSDDRWLTRDQLFDYILLNDFNGGDLSGIGFNYQQDFSNNFNESANISSIGVGGEQQTGSRYFPYRDRDSSVDTRAIWLAAQGNYMRGRLNTLFGVRLDRIHLKAVGRQIAAGTGSDVDEIYNETSPTLGALFWLNQNIGVFANYAQSIESPTGWQLNPTGDTIPAELGTGVEVGTKFEFLDGALSGQLTFFQIDKENDNLTRYSKQQLERLYPEEAFPEIWGPSDWNPNVNSFKPIGTNIGGIVTRSEGVEFDLYYNPSRELSFFLGYAYADAFFQSGPEDALGNSLIEYGDRIPGTAHHSANLTVRYSIRDGKLKGWFAGTNLKYRSKSYYDELYADVGTDGAGAKIYDGKADIVPLVNVNGEPHIEGETKSYELWLSDSFTTKAFVGWGGKFKKGRDVPYFRFQLTVNNVFDARDLIATGRNARYTPGRSASFSASIKF